MPKKTKLQRQKIKKNKVSLSPEQQYKQALVLIENKHYLSSSVFLEKCIAANNHHHDAIIKLIEVYDKLISTHLKSKEFKKADVVLIKRLQLSRDDINNWIILEIQLQNKKYNEALSFYTEFYNVAENQSIKEQYILSKLIPYIFSIFSGLPKAFKRTSFYKESKYAYCLFNKVLNGISFDEKEVKHIRILGAYKDLRLIIRVLQQLKNRGISQKILSQIKPDSVFYNLSMVLSAALMPSYLAFNILQHVNEAELYLFKSIKGLNEREYKLLLKLISNRILNNKQDYIFNLLLNSSDLFGEYGINLLKGQLWQSNRRIQEYQQKIGELSDIELLKYSALWHEKSHKYCCDAENNFDALAKIYTKSKLEKKKASIVFLHLAKYYANDQDEKIAYYNNAIKHNKHDATTYQLLIKENIRSYSISSPKTTKCITQGIKACPDNIELQELRIQSFYEIGDYGNAITLAKNILNIRPANKIYRAIMMKSLLSQSLFFGKQGKYKEINTYYDELSRYISEVDKKVFKSLILVGDLLATPLMSKFKDGGTIPLESDFEVLSFMMQGVLLGYSAKKQFKIIKDLAHKLQQSLSSLDTLLVVLPYFIKEIPKKDYGDISPIVTQALTAQNGEIEPLLKLGFLLEDSGLKKILNGYSKYFTNKTVIGEIAIFYFDIVGKKLSNNPVKIISLINQLSVMKCKLKDGGDLQSRIERLIKKLSTNMPMPKKLNIPKELKDFLEVL